LRRVDFTFRAHAATVALCGLLAAAPTCGDASSPIEGAEARRTNGDLGSPPLADERTSSDAAATSAPLTFRGNPLCRVSSGEQCMPDDDGTGTPLGQECAVVNNDLDGGESLSACRLTKSAAGSIPVCASPANVDGTDGVACVKGADCAPGFDCVEGGGGGVCRRYCCMGTCAGQTAKSGGDTFCDVQRLLEAGTKAPVCMPIQPCDLFQDGTCSLTQTCAVVTESGDTGCVSIGPQQAGEPCDELHCAAGLTCIGQAGSGRCYELCKVGASTCPGSLECKTSTIFQNPEYGVCQ
jgi:hypothetical protein